MTIQIYSAGLMRSVSLLICAVLPASLQQEFDQNYKNTDTQRHFYGNDELIKLKELKT